jgi:hypothetical protein
MTAPQSYVLWPKRCSQRTQQTCARHKLGPGVAQQHAAVGLLPCRGVASFSDGPPNSATGRLFFYMTPMDETTQLFTVSMSACVVFTNKLPQLKSWLAPARCHITATNSWSVLLVCMYRASCMLSCYAVVRTLSVASLLRASCATCASCAAAAACRATPAAPSP